MANLRAWADANGISDVDYITKGLFKKTAIEAKQAELKQKCSDAKTELKQWLKDNNIDEKYLQMGWWGRNDSSDHDGHHDHDWKNQ